MTRSDLTHVHRSSRSDTTISQQRWFDDDSEWEYEYDDNETEDVYFTVDLTTHVPDAFVKQSKETKNGKTFRGNLDARLRAKSARYADAPPTEEIASPSNATPDPSQTAETTAETPADEIVQPARNVVQFVGLDTASPCLVYNNDFFTAYWLTDIGTELWITAPGQLKSAVHRGDVLDILGTSRARLMAMPAKLEPRYDEENPAPDSTEAENVEETSELNATSILASITAAVPQQYESDKRLQAQASFMEKFQALKRKKGENDVMPVYSVKQYEYPADAVQIRIRALDELDKEHEAKKQRRAEQPKLIRQPGEHGTKVTKPGMRGNVRGTKTTKADQAVQSTETPEAAPEDADLMDEEEEEEAESRDVSASLEPIQAGETAPRRGRLPRAQRLVSMGLTDQIHEKRS